MTYDEVFSYKNLLDSAYKCLKGVGWKKSTQLFKLRLVVNVFKLWWQLKKRTYKSKGFYEFDINERGKTRHIMSVHISERVVQKCLCDYCLLPILTPSLIYDNGACLKGKGISFTQNRLKEHLHSYYRHYGKNGYILKVDFKDYFNSVDHSILKSKLDKKILDDDIKNLLYTLIDNCGDKGLGLGSQISQILALFYTSNLDHYIKEHLHIKYYGRYMDDVYLLCPNKEYLKDCLTEIRKITNSLNITLNTKTGISKIDNGFTFLKHRYFITDCGKVLSFPNKDDFKRFKHKIHKANKRELFNSLYGATKDFNCYWQLRTISNTLIEY